MPEYDSHLTQILYYYLSTTREVCSSSSFFLFLELFSHKTIEEYRCKNWGLTFFHVVWFSFFSTGEEEEIDFFQKIQNFAALIQKIWVFFTPHSAKLRE